MTSVVKMGMRRERLEGCWIEVSGPRTEEEKRCRRPR